MLMITPTAIGFDMGATSTKTGVVKDGKIIFRGEIIQTRQDGDVASLIDAFVKEIQRLRTYTPEASAVGFGVPGIINPVEGTVVNLTNVKGWHNIPLRLFGYIRQTIWTHCERTFWEKLDIVSATLHNDAGIIGPAVLAVESEFRRGPQVESKL